MPETRYVLDERGNVISRPELMEDDEPMDGEPGEGEEVVEEVEEVEEPLKPKRKIDPLFEVPQPEDNDMYVDDLVAAPGDDEIGIDGEANFDDIVEVDFDRDIMGDSKPKKKKVRVVRRVVRRTPPTALGGMR